MIAENVIGSSPYSCFKTFSKNTNKKNKENHSRKDWMTHELIITVFEASLSDSFDIQFDKQHGLYSILVGKNAIQSKIKSSAC